MILSTLQNMKSYPYDLNLDLHLSKYLLDLFSDHIQFSCKLQRTPENNLTINKLFFELLKKNNQLPLTFQFTKKNYQMSSFSDLFYFIQHDFYTSMITEFETIEQQMNQELNILDSFTLPNQTIGSRHIPEKERIELFTKYFPQETLQDNQWVKTGENNEDMIQLIHQTILQKYNIQDHAENIKQYQSIVANFLSSMEQLYKQLIHITIYLYNIQGT